jgi:hypothetical protein
LESLRIFSFIVELDANAAANWSSNILIFAASGVAGEVGEVVGLLSREVGPKLITWGEVRLWAIGRFVSVE